MKLQKDNNNKKDKKWIQNSQKKKEKRAKYFFKGQKAKGGNKNKLRMSSHKGQYANFKTFCFGCTFKTEIRL